MHTQHDLLLDKFEREFQDKFSSAINEIESKHAEDHANST